VVIIERNIHKLLYHHQGNKTCYIYYFPERKWRRGTHWNL